MFLMFMVFIGTVHIIYRVIYWYKGWGKCIHFIGEIQCKRTKWHRSVRIGCSTLSQNGGFFASPQDYTASRRSKTFAKYQKQRLISRWELSFGPEEVAVINSLNRSARAYYSLPKSFRKGILSIKFKKNVERTVTKRKMSSYYINISQCCVFIRFFWDNNQVVAIWLLDLNTPSEWDKVQLCFGCQTFRLFLRRQKKAKNVNSLAGMFTQILTFGLASITFRSGFL